jgi:hypothetical protein
MRHFTLASRLSATLLVGALTALSPLADAQVSYVGDAAALNANVAGIVNVSISSTGSLPSTGGELSTSLLNFAVPPTLTLNLLTANTAGQDNQTNSQAAVTDVTLNVAGIYVRASVLNASATATCYADSAAVSGNSTIIALKVNGLSIKVTGQPNQTIPLLIGSLVINEQISQVTSPPQAITADIVVNALHLTVDLLADVVVSHAHAGMVCDAYVPV